MLTKAGNQVMVGEDTDGRVYFVDKGGNLYYDSGDPEVGMYVVSLPPCRAQGKMTAAMASLTAAIPGSADHGRRPRVQPV